VNLRLAKYKAFAQTRGATSLFSTAVITGHSISEQALKSHYSGDRLTDSKALNHFGRYYLTLFDFQGVK